jgi:hypothetical protein
MWAAFSDRGYVIAGTFASDDGGGATSSWAMLGGTVACRLDPVGERGSSRVVGGRIDERSTHVVSVPATVTVQTGNRFAINGRGTFEVTATRDRTDAWMIAFEVFRI